MGKRQKQTRQTRPVRQTRAQRGTAEIIEFTSGKFDHERNLKPIEPRNRTQAEYLKALRSSPQVVVMGPAGTGKTYIAGTFAADQLRQGDIDKIILSRPNVSGSKSIGYFPGTLEEKFGPWLAQIIHDIQERMGRAAFEIAVKNGQIEMVPFEVMRGRSFKNAFVLLDEAQNTTIDEIKMFLTRQGEDSTVVVNGDISQSDLKESSGLAKMIHLIKAHGLPVPIIEFGIEDIVRSGLCRMWVETFHAAGL